MKNTIAILLCLFATLTVQAQGKQTIVAKKIKSQTIFEQNLEKGETKATIQKKEVYNKQGLLAEEVTYNEKGKIKDWKRYTYNKDENIITEEELNANGNVLKKIEHVYSNGLKTEKNYYNAKGKIYKKKNYKYEFNNQ